MRKVEEIRADIERAKLCVELDCGDRRSCDDCEAKNMHYYSHFTEELRAALTASIPLDRLEQICQAEREGRLDIGPCKCDETNYRFFYCDSEDSYLLGHRVDNFYYAHWHGNLGWVWDMSRYLPWGETVNGFTYCSEPREVDTSTWMRGFCTFIARAHPLDCAYVYYPKDRAEAEAMGGEAEK